MILINSLCVPDVPLQVLWFLNLHLHKVFLIFFSLKWVML